MYRRGTQLVQGFLAVGGGLDGEAPGLDHFGQTGALILFVVSHEDTSRGPGHKIAHYFNCNLTGWIFLCGSADSQPANARLGESEVIWKGFNHCLIAGSASNAAFSPSAIILL